MRRAAIALAATTALVVAACAGEQATSRDYLVPRNDKNVLDDAYVRMLDGVAASGGDEHARPPPERDGRSIPHEPPEDVEAPREARGCPDYCDKGSVDSLSNDWRPGELRRPLRRYVRAHRTEFFGQA